MGELTVVMRAIEEHSCNFVCLLWNSDDVLVSTARAAAVQWLLAIHCEKLEVASGWDSGRRLCGIGRRI